jgi:peptidoglycan/LPS O-acetylase OafA/YrhL
MWQSSRVPLLERIEMDLSAWHAHLLGGAIGVAVYASIFSAFSPGPTSSTGYRAAFLTAAGLVVVLALLSLSQTTSRRAEPERLERT